MAKLDAPTKIFMVAAIPVFLLDLVIYFLSLEWLQKIVQTPSLYSFERGEATATHGAPRSSTKDATLVTTVYDGETVYDMVKGSITKFQDRVAMRSRTFVDVKKVKETDRFPSKIFDDKAGFVDITYEELGMKLNNFGAGLRELGLEPQPELGNTNFDDAKGNFCMVIFEDTCAEWTIACQGAFSQKMTVATCYATLGDDAVISAVNETSASALFLNFKNATKFSKLAHKMPSLKTIIASTHEMPAGTATPKSESKNVKIVTLLDVIAMGQKNSVDPVPPKPTDVAVIMYTSGSTGKPKGVVMKHSQLVAGVSGMVLNVHLRKGQEIYVSYLPLAHILALQIENVLLSVGTTLCYTDPRQIAKALPMYKPTIFAGVPKVWSMLENALEKKIAAGPAALRIVFSALITWKLQVLKVGMDTPVSNLFFNLISSKVFGGTLQFGVSGGGPIGGALHDFCRACFNCPIIQGYALTETCVGGCFQATNDMRSGVVGPPVPCVEIVLQSEPDIKDGAGLPYLYTDTKGSKGESILGRGEICMRGPCISSGYYKLPEKTKEEYDSEGFFHTGDIGQFTADGVIQIIDRKKNLVKLRGGEYVAVEAMETAFVNSKLVMAVCVVASGDLDAPLAIVRAENGALEQWAAENGVSYDSLEKLAELEATRKAVVKSMVAEGKDAGCTSLELRMKDCTIVTQDEWSPGKGMTATMKIDRKALYSMYEKELDVMYKRNGVTVSN
mmetsp:Transcript_22681/g.37524  ORF Transcript_22681/g.37524 Transcript_22681/m.37524 type:complete len:730 (-) Transcript_22681:56-2245(-)|eukprot:CAMPEP_0119015784 /NCGR_PEP_ID=MMETSP1176-20130426/11617_1 /TAXON_ID=265551 /ORGANISM="Synedropsis recta cf, Strain CCMP1620" /LENGTH=729 /DNA_ID=CAMNT_0006969105 /DNA_START=98 /DNA_END=2287 /DNA_ORIENTATION=-